MKRFLIHITLSCFLFLGCWSLGIIMVGDFFPEAFQKNLRYHPGAYGHMYSRIQEADTIQQIDILVLGSSHAYRGFDPRIFKANEINLFNFGSSSQTPLQSYHLLKDYRAQLQPKMVILECYPTLLNSDGVESALDIISNKTIEKETIKMAVKTNNVSVYNTLIYSLYEDLNGNKAAFEEPLYKERDGDTYIPGGYVEKKSNTLKRHRSKQPEPSNLRTNKFEHSKP